MVDLVAAFGLSTDNVKNQAILNKAIKAIKSPPKEFELKFNEKNFMKSLQIANAEIDKTTGRIKSMMLSAQSATGKTTQISLGVSDKGKVTITAVNEINNYVKAGQKYLTLTKQIASIKEKINKLPTAKEDITPLMQQQLDSYNARLKSLNATRKAVGKQMQDSGIDYKSLYEKARMLEDVEVSEKKRQQDIRNETKKTSDAKRDAEKKIAEDLRKYESNLKSVVQQEKILTVEREKSLKSSANKTPESKNLQDIARRNIETLRKENDKLKQSFVGNDKALRSTIDLEHKYGNEIKQNTALVKSHYAENKSLFRDMMSGWKEATARIINYTVIYRSIWALIQGFQNGVQTIQNLDKSFTDIRMVTGATVEETAKLAKEYSNLATQMGFTISDVASGATEWLRQGKTAKETSGLLKESMILSKTGAMESAEATEYLTSTMNGYKMEVQDASRVVDVFSKLDMSAATSSKELAIAFSRTANSASDAGMGFEELAGYITTVSETTRRSASTVGEAFKTVFSRLSNVKVGKLIDDETGESINDVEKALGSLGIKLRKSPTEWREASDVLKDVGSNWKNYNDLQKNTIVTSLAGTRQAEIMRSAFNNFDKVLDYTNKAYESTGSSADKYGVYLESVEAKQNKLTSSLQSIAYQPVFEEMYKGLLDVGVALTDALKLLMSTPATFLAIGVALKRAFGTQINAGIASTVNSLGELGNVAKLAKSSTNVEVLASAFVKLEPSAQKAALANKAFSKATLEAMLGTEALTKAEEAKILVEKASAVQTTIATGVTATFGNVLKGVMLTLVASPVFWIMAAITGVTLLKGVFDKFNVTLEEQQEILAKVQTEYDDVVSKIESLNSELDNTKKRMAELQSMGVLKPTEQAELNHLIEQNAELEREIKLQESLKQLKAEKLNQETIKTIDKKSEKSIDVFGGVTQNVSIDRASAIKERIDAYNILKKETSALKDQQALYKAGSKSYNDRQKTIDANSKAMAEYATYISDTTTALQEEKKGLVGTDEATVKAKTSIENIVTSVIDFTNAINGVKAETTGATDAIKAQLSPLEQALQDYNNGSITFAEYTKQVRDAKVATAQYDTELANISSTQTFLNGIIEKTNSHQEITEDEYKQLIALSPALDDSITKTANGYMLQNEAATALNSTLESLKNANLAMENALTKATIDGTLNRVKAYGEEINALKARAKAMMDAFESVQGGGPRNTSKLNPSSYDFMKTGGFDSPWNLLPNAFPDAVNLNAIDDAQAEIDRIKKQVGTLDYSAVKIKNEDKGKEKDKDVDVLEEYNKNKAIIDAKIQLSQTTQALNEEGSKAWYDEVDKQVEYQKNTQSLANAEANRLRKLGYSNNSKEVLQLKQDYMTASAGIKELGNAIQVVYDKKKSWYELVISNSKATQGLYEEDSAEYIAQQKKQYDYYVEMQKLSHAQADKLRKLGFKETSEEILQLKNDYITASLNIKAFTDDLIKSFKDGYADSLSDELQAKIDKLNYQKDNDRGISNLQKQIDAEQARLDLLEQSSDEEAKKTEEIRKQKELIDSLTKQKDIRVFSSEKGWTWDRDNAKIEEEQSNLTTMESDLQKIQIQTVIDALQERLDKANAKYDDQIKALELQISNMKYLSDLHKKKEVPTLEEVIDKLKDFGDGSESAITSLLDWVDELRSEMGLSAVDRATIGTGTGGGSVSGGKVYNTAEGYDASKLKPGDKVVHGGGITTINADGSKTTSPLPNGSGTTGSISEVAKIAKDLTNDEGGLNFGKGFMAKDIVEPERVLSPEQTKSFESLVRTLPQITPVLKSFNSMTPSQVRNSNATDNSVSIANLTIQAQNGDTLQSLLLEAKNIAKINKR